MSNFKSPTVFGHSKNAKKMKAVIERKSASSLAKGKPKVTQMYPNKILTLSSAKQDWEISSLKQIEEDEEWNSEGTKSKRGKEQDEDRNRSSIPNLTQESNSELLPEIVESPKSGSLSKKSLSFKDKLK